MLIIKSFGQLASSTTKSGATNFLNIQSLPTRLISSRYLTSNQSPADLIKIDDSCLERLKKILTQPDREYLRINVETGGCSGFSYVFAIDYEQQIQADEDLIFKRDEYRVVVNKEILPFIKGSTVEYNESLIKSSFQIVNPIADSSCSCGSSFSVDLSRLQQISSKDQKNEG